ncbi:MAG: hypothetical protein H6818_05775 [Phycisphaerales bacterium]|nr:hypothetical protein [Phycisphaerales bacterium]MCB9862771.1 hypothetical protein [Phycisphaerales bacterium]
MKRHAHNLTIMVPCIVAALFVSTASVVADNGYQVVSYNIRENPADPQSNVIFRVTFELTKADQVSGSIGWEISSAYFEQPLPTGGDNVWKTDSPTVDTPDGLWWVQHELPGNPKLSEFDAPPPVSGQANTFDPQFSNTLIFYFAGLGGTHDVNTARIRYSFKMDDEEDPEAEDDDGLGEIIPTPRIPGEMVGAASDSALSCNSIDATTLLRDLGVDCQADSSELHDERV